MGISTYTNYAGTVLSLSNGASNYLLQPLAGLTIYGTDLNDILKDNFGGNVLAGGKGDDTYHIVDPNTVISELAGGGIDTAITWTSYRLPANVEVLSLPGPNLTGWANDTGSLIIANGERSTLVSGKGSDVLVDAGAGGNTFSFSKGGGNDVIYGFKSGAGFNHDAIKLVDYGFTSFEQVQKLLSQVGSDTRLTLANGDKILMKDVQASTLTADNFRLQLDTSKMKLAFSDEFNSISLYDSATKTGTWTTTYNWGPENGEASIYARTSLNNGEKQIYVDPKALVLGKTPVGINPFSVKDGVLDITAAKTPDALKAQLFGYNYTSGLLTTEKTFAQTYGYFEIRADMPGSKGMFPAFWLLREDKVWPPELDVFEDVGTDDIFQGFGSKDANSDNRSVVSTVEGATKGFHTYGLLWTAETISWYIDGVQTGSVPTPSDMHSPMYMLVNLAVGGHWAGDPNANFTSDSLKVDYIRAYALDTATTPPATTPVATPPVTSAPGNTSNSTTPVATPEPVATNPDHVKAAITTALANGVHDLTLTGSAAVNGTGNALDNHIVGNDAANVLSGMAGDDVLEGGGGNDTLTGGTGADTLIGGAGDDTYYVDDARAVIIEKAGEGNDAVYASVTYTASNYVERIYLTGTAAIDAHGGDTGVQMLGNSAVNHLWGGAGNDILDGGKGIDILEGGAGNDTYYIDTATEVVIEAAGAGVDTVYSSASYKMAENVENLTLLYTADLSGTGNSLDNVITGNSGANKLTGGAGFDTLIGGAGDDTLDGGYNNDVLTGGEGADKFVFGLKSGVDTVTDFGAKDTLDVSAWYAAGYKASVYMVGLDTYVSDSKGDVIVLTGVASSHLQATATGFAFI